MRATWILTSYLVSNAIVLPISGWLSNVIGRKRFYMSCVAIFTVSSVLCGFATSLELHGYVPRSSRASAAAAWRPPSSRYSPTAFRRRCVRMAFALYGLTVVVAPAIGPVLGGYLTDDYSWHWVFLINLPVGLLSLTLTHLFVYEPKALRDERRKLLTGRIVDRLCRVHAGGARVRLVADRAGPVSARRWIFLDVHHHAGVDLFCLVWRAWRCGRRCIGSR